MNPIVVTFATDKAHPGLQRLSESCARWGWPLRIIESRWLGWGGRLRRVVFDAPLLREAGYTHMVHVDAYDVVCVGPPVELDFALVAYHQPAVLLAAEAVCWPPDEGMAASYEPRASHWWYAHSQFVLDLGQTVPANLIDVEDNEDDQRHLHRVVLAKTPGVVIDRSCRVVQSIAHCHPWQEFFMVLGGKHRIVNRVIGSMPLFIHGNGQTEMGWVCDDDPPDTSE